MQKIVLIGSILEILLIFSSNYKIYGQELNQIESPPFNAEKDKYFMLQQLGIQKLRPGADADDKSPNKANYDESKANPCPTLPVLLQKKDGTQITTGKIWWESRRNDILYDVQQEIYGHPPTNPPAIKWKVKITDREFVGRIPVIARQIIGEADNSGFPQIQLNIKMMLVLPANLKTKVPVLVMFGLPIFPAPAQPAAADLEKINEVFKRVLIEKEPSLKQIFERYPAYSPLNRNAANNFFATGTTELSPTEQLLAAGWGYCTLDATSIQPDNAAGLGVGIIGLANKGNSRSPEQWGALRAWAWGASRAMDYLETDTLVDSRRVGIEGVSRYGKAALLAMATDQRFAIGLIGSSGKGGTTLHRRIYGEAVENLTGGSYYWMAGNYMKYGAEQSDFGRKTACDLPVDAHHLIALCAPRPIFISYGVPEKGDAKWLDHEGSYMAVLAASEVYKLLEGNNRFNHNLPKEMPPVGFGLLDGKIAWRQHEGGHTDAPNFKYFIPWANTMLGIQTNLK